MKRTLRFAMLACAAIAVVTIGPEPTVVAQAQINTGRCIFNVPQEWGTFKGMSERWGLLFEDSSGNIRSITQMPCGLEGTPNVALEIHRR
jgi:hypothetical protein